MISSESGGSGLGKGIKVGTVVDNKDPKQWGRVRVRVAQVFEGIANEHLPWALPSLAHPGGASAAHGRFEVPEIGAKVLVEFQNESVLHPMYKGYFIDDGTILQEAKPNYPDRSVTLWPSGSMIIIDKKTQDVFVRNEGDLHFYVTGDAYIKVDGNLTQHVGGNRYTSVAGNDYLVVGGEMGCYSATMKLKASGLQAISAGAAQALYAGGSSTRDAAGVIHDDSGVGDMAGSAPGAPSFPGWPGVRGKTPG
jgi:hypothetical protein